MIPDPATPMSTDLAQRVQVIIPAFNAAVYIAETIESVLGQSAGRPDLLVLDNASTDATQAVVARYESQGVRYVRHPINIGALGNHNRALDLATAPYLKILSADDVLLPEVIASQVAALDANPDAGVSTCNCIVTDARLVPLSETCYLPGRMAGTQAVAQCVGKVANLIGAPSNVLLRRSIVGDLRFDPTLKWLGDLDFFCRVLERSDFVNIDAVGFYYRRHDASDSSVSCSHPVRFHDERVFARRHGGGPLAQARIAYRMARERLSTLGVGTRVPRP